MKQIKLFNYLLVVVLCLGFTSCSNNDNVDPASLLETWEVITVKEWWHENGVKQTKELNRSHEYIYYIFKADNTGYYYYYEDPRHNFTWKLEKNRITITEDGDTEPLYDGAISINKNQLLIEERGKDEEGYEYGCQTLLERVLSIKY